MSDAQLAEFRKYPFYAIVVEQSPASLWYFDRILPTWHARGLNPQLFPASTPESIKGRTELKFLDRMYMRKYVTQKIKKPFSPKEQAVWYSHFDMWQKCVELDQTIAVIEHDSFLVNPENLVARADISFFDANAMGGYIINPKAAKRLVEISLDQDHGVPPFSFIVWLSSNRRNLIDYTLHIPNVSSKQSQYASMPIINHTIGNTISDRYDSLSPAELEKMWSARLGSIENLPRTIHVKEDTLQWMLDHGFPPFEVKNEATQIP